MAASSGAAHRAVIASLIYIVSMGLSAEARDSGFLATEKGTAYIRCATPQPTEKELKLIEQRFAKLRAQIDDNNKIPNHSGTDPRRAGNSKDPGSREDGERGFDGTIGGAFSSPPIPPAGSIEIPVVFHVITSASNGFLSESMINDQIRVLNDAFNGNTGGAPSPYVFNLAAVTQTQDLKWFNNCGGSAERDMKTALRQGGAETLNVYTCNIEDDILGFASSPNGFTGDPIGDGVVLLHSSLPGGTAVPYNEGDTLVHEVGHWLGLFHTFLGGCEGQGDRASDTPAEAFPAYGCPISRDSCDSEKHPGADPVSNFMDYVDDVCMFEFTQEQAERAFHQSRVFRGLDAP